MDNEKKWLFGPPKTTNKPTAEMCSYELMLNNCYIDNENAMYRDFFESRDIHSLIRDIAKSMRVYLTDDPELLDITLFDYLDSELDTTDWVLGLLYALLWSKAELYEKLKRYEDAEERGEIGYIPRWIPVTERVPDIDALVLTYCPHRKGTPGETQIMRGWAAMIHATHWMPLPTLPEVE